MFAVNILGEDHEELSQPVREEGRRPLLATPWRIGVSGAPVLEEAIAYLDCQFEAEYPGGDHKIVVGRVLDVDMREDARPLLFYKGGYGRITTPDTPPAVHTRTGVTEVVRPTSVTPVGGPGR